MLTTYRSLKPVSQLRIVQWNVLADVLSDSFPHLKGRKDILSWEARFPKILSHLRNLKADIITLEVQIRSTRPSLFILLDKNESNSPSSFDFVFDLAGSGSF
jgi:hypothetical protein